MITSPQQKHFILLLILCLCPLTSYGNEYCAVFSPLCPDCPVMLRLLKEKQEAEAIQASDILQGHCFRHVQKHGLFVIDGDTFYWHKEKIRLFGIDALEREQLCTDKQGDTWPCGQKAKDHLEQILASSPLFCELVTTDRYQRSIKRCHGSDADIAQTMVRNGHALAYRKYSKEYINDEAYARNQAMGMWRGTFEHPLGFRITKPRVTEYPN